MKITFKIELTIFILFQFTKIYSQLYQHDYYKQILTDINLYENLETFRYLFNSKEEEASEETYPEEEECEESSPILGKNIAEKLIDLFNSDSIDINQNINIIIEFLENIYNNAEIALGESLKNVTNKKQFASKIRTLGIKNLNQSNNNLFTFSQNNKITYTHGGILNSEQIVKAKNSLNAFILEFFLRISIVKTNSTRLRVLEEVNENEEEISNALYNIHELNKALLVSGEMTNWDDLENNNTFPFSLYRFPFENISEYINQAKDDQAMIYPTSKESYYAVSTLPNKMKDYYSDIGIMVNIYDKNKNPSDEKEISVGYDISFENSTLIQLKYYQSKGVNMIDWKDPAFTKKCYTNLNLEYDLTQKYRRTKLYLGELTSDKCNFSQYDMVYDKFKCTCEYSNYNTGSMNISFTKKDLDEQIKNNKKSFPVNKKTKTVNLLFKCSKEIVDISTNIAFWLFFSLWIAYLIVLVLHFFLNKSWYLQDEEVKGLPTNTNLTNENLKTAEINLGEPTLLSLILDLILEYHPLLSLFHYSLINPNWLNALIFVLNIHCHFAFNAIFFSENSMQKMINNKKRRNFGYPMGHHFGKIILSILISILATLICRGILYIPKEEYESERDRIKLAPNREKAKLIKSFDMSQLIRRLIVAGFIVAFSIFCWYCSIVFCGIYPNTQHCWFYSGIWALLWNWIIFANIAIVVIAFVEHFTNDKKYPYILKRFFIF